MKKRKANELELDVEQFIHSEGVDETAANGLRELSYELQQQVINRGTLDGKNPSAMLIGRVRDAKRSAGIPTLRHAEQLNVVEQFIQSEGVDETAANGLRELPHELQLQVMNRGTLDGKNPSAMLIGRVRDAKRSAGIPTLRQAEQLNVVEQFIQSEGVDETAANGLRELPYELQQQVISRGSLDGKNPSAMLIGRVRDAKRSAGIPTLGQVNNFMWDQSTDTKTATRFRGGVYGNFAGMTNLNEVEQFILDEGVDEVAANGLRELPWNLQQQIMSRGTLAGNNPSAMLIGRVRDAKRDFGVAHTHLTKTPLPGSAVARMPAAKSARVGDAKRDFGMFLTPMTKASFSMNAVARVTNTPAFAIGDVEQFIRDEGVDENAASGLRELPGELQQQVMSRGTLAGKNPSAMLIGRVRDAKRSAGMPNTNLVEQFISREGVDERASKDLRELPWALQKQIIDRGSLSEGKNPSAMLIGRIRDAKRSFGM